VLPSSFLILKQDYLAAPLFCHFYLKDKKWQKELNLKSVVASSARQLKRVSGRRLGSIIVVGGSQASEKG